MMHEQQASPKPDARRPRSTAADQRLTIGEVTEELGVSGATSYRWRACLKGPANLRLTNGTIRIRRSALKAFLATCDQHGGLPR